MHQVVLDHALELLRLIFLFNAFLKRFLTSLDCLDLVSDSDAGTSCSDSQSLPSPGFSRVLNPISI